MKIGKLEIKKHKQKPISAVRYNGNTLFYIETSKKDKRSASIKNKKLLTGIVAGTIATSLFVGGLVGCVSNSKEIPNKVESSITAVNQNNVNDETLNFKTMQYGDKTFLTLDEEDLLELIELSMFEVDKEYLDNKSTACFASGDSEYSHFTKYHILGLLQTESSFRLLEIKDANGDLFSLDNHASFVGTDKQGVIYHGPGMMNSDTVDYIVNKDRNEVNKFKNYNHFKIDGKDVEITFDNLNPYNYVLASNASTKEEVQQALKESIILNVKCIYTYLNRIVKNSVKEGTHDAELEKLNSYSQFKSLSETEKQIAFALIGYNNGPAKSRTALMDGSLFDKVAESENNGEYKINVKYAKKVMEKAGEFESLYADELGIS